MDSLLQHTTEEGPYFLEKRFEYAFKGEVWQVAYRLDAAN